MESLDVTPDVERAPWTDLTEVVFGKLSRIGLLRNGTEEGRATVALVIELTDGTHVVAENDMAPVQHQRSCARHLTHRLGRG